MLDRYYADVPRVIVEPGVQTGVPLLVDNPREVGADRLVNTLAAHHLYGGAVVIVDFGTSTNLDVVSGKGEFLGGALAPGIEISVEALAARARAAAQGRARRAAVGRSARTPSRRCRRACSTASPARSTGWCAGSSRELGGDVTVIATGGLSALVIEHCETVDIHEPDLTLVGLRLVYEKNT